MAKLIGFAGRKASGKGAAAAATGFRVIKFADALKDMGRSIGLTEAQIEGDMKEMPSALLCGLTPRQFMQRLGTEFGRDMVGSDFWVEIWKHRVRKALRNGENIVVDDVRFPNEMQAVLDFGGDLYRVIRPGQGDRTDTHPSETALDGFDFPVLLNDGSLNDLSNRVSCRTALLEHSHVS